MASSGSFNTTAYDGRYLHFSWSIKSQSVANNQTVISWSLDGAGGSTSTFYMAGNFKVVINGVTVYQSEDRIRLFNGTNVASGTATIKHNNDGSKTFSASAQAGIYNYEVNCKGSGSWSLTTIPRYATVSQSLTAKTETTLTVKWTSDSTIDYIWYSSNNGSNWHGINVTDGKSGSYTISGLDDGTSYKVKTRVRSKSTGLTTDSSALSVSTYDYPYANKMPDFQIGNTATIGLFNPLKRTVTVRFYGADGAYKDIGTTSSTTIGVPTDSTWVSWLYGTIPTSQSGAYRVRCLYDGHTWTKDGGSYSAKLADAAPIIGSVAYADQNTQVTGITQDDQLIVRNLSTVRYSAAGLSARFGATIASVKVTVNGKSYNLTLDGSGAAGGDATINSGTDVTAVFTVTDSRGLTETDSVTVRMLDYGLPTAIIAMARRNNFYSETDILVDANFSPIDGKNAVTIGYQARVKGTETYTVTGSLQDNVPAVITLANSDEWEVKITLTDLLGGTTSYNAVVPRGMPIIFFDRLRESVGVNCFPQHDGTLEVDGQIYLNGEMLKPPLVTQVFEVSDISLSAGRIGTKALQRSVTITKAGYTPIAATVTYVSNSNRFFPIVFFSSGRDLLYADFHRTSENSSATQSTAYSTTGVALRVVVAYLKD